MVARSPEGQAQQFLHALFGLWPTVSQNQDAKITLWFRQSKRSIHKHYSKLDHIVADAMRADDQQEDVYVACALHKPEIGKKRGKASDAIAIPGLWLDIDLHHPDAHAAENLPASVDDVEDLLSTFPLEPSLVVHTGFGLHAWWLPKEGPRSIDRLGGRVEATLLLKSFEQHFVARSADRGWKLDPVNDLARVLRLPGTRNHKLAADLRPVRTVLHETAAYSWDDLEKAIRDLPPVEQKRLITGRLAAAVPADPSRSARPEHEVIQDLTSKHGLLRRMPNPELQGALALVLEGKPFAPEGSRENTLARLCAQVAWVEPDYDPAVLAKIFRPSLDEMASESDPESENPPPSFDDAVDKIARAQADRRRIRRIEREKADAAHESGWVRKGVEATQAARANLNALAAAEPVSASVPDVAASGADAGVPESPPSSAASHSSAESPVPPPTSTPAPSEPTPDPLEAELAQLQPFDRRMVLLARKAGVSYDEMRKRRIVMHQNMYYVLVGDEYQAPVTQQALIPSLQQDWAENREDGDQFWIYKENAKTGVQTLKSEKEIMCEVGRVARHVVVDLTRQSSALIGQTFHWASTPIRPIKPKFHQEIQDWLESLPKEGPKSDDCKRFLDWIATSTDLERQTSALYIQGLPNCGKSLLTAGLGRIYGTQVSELARVIDNFNQHLERNPIIVCDENLPQRWQGKRTLSELRSLLGTSSRIFSKKYAHDGELKGAVRLIMTANNPNMLQLGEEDLSGNDIEAIAQRILVIEVGQAAVDFLKKLNSSGGPGTNGWVEERSTHPGRVDMIAEHILWMRENRKVIPGTRFLVEGQGQALANRLIINSSVCGNICQMISTVLSDEKSEKVASYDGTVIAGGGELLVLTEGVQSAWKQYVSSTIVPPHVNRIGSALRNLSTGEVRIVDLGSRRRRYHVVNPVFVLAWAEENGIGDPDLMRDRVDKGEKTPGITPKILVPSVKAEVA